jgi:hypothetical protein
MIETVSMRWIKAQASGPFFSPRAMKFFNSRLPDTGLRNGDRVFFWTSERCDWAGDAERQFTLRMLDLVTGKVDTVGEFQQYPTAAAAQAAVRNAARNGIEVPS